MQKLLEACEAVSEKIHDEEFAKLIENIRNFDNEDWHKPTITFVDLCCNTSQCLGLLKKYVSIDIPHECFRLVQETEIPYIFLDYSEKPKIANERFLHIGLPSETLKNYSLIMMCQQYGDLEDYFHLDVLSKTDVLCLLTNACMAMTMYETEWLEDCARYCNPIISLFNMELLDEEEIVLVHSYVNEKLGGLGINAKIFDSPNEAMGYMKNLLCEERSHKSHALKFYLSALRKNVEGLASSTFTDEQKITQAISALRQQQKSLEEAGQFTAENIFYNSMSGLRQKISDSIRGYAQQMSANIAQEVEAASFEELEFIDEKINSYVQSSFTYYTDKTLEIIRLEQKKIMDNLIVQIEADADAFISGLDEATRETVHAALCHETHGGIQMTNPSAKIDSSQANNYYDSLKRETRNMMLLSIPMLFVSPVLAVGNIFASKFIERFRRDGVAEDVKKEIIRRARILCSQIAEEMIRGFYSCFEQETKRAAYDIKSAYKILTDRIIADIEAMRKEHESIIEIKECLEELSNGTISEIA